VAMIKGQQTSNQTKSPLQIYLPHITGSSTKYGEKTRNVALNDVFR
jgi:hypothetical protein